MERFIYIPLSETSLSKSSNHFSPKYLIIQSKIRYSACTWSYFVVVPVVVLQVLLIYYPWLNVDLCFWSSVFPGRKKPTRYIDWSSAHLEDLLLQLFFRAVSEVGCGVATIYFWVVPPYHAALFVQKTESFFFLGNQITDKSCGLKNKIM